MCKNLYFISILSRALLEKDLDQSLARAFSEIKQQGQESEYMEGFLNFESFMSITRLHHEILVNGNSLDIATSSSAENVEVSFEIGLLRDHCLTTTQCIESPPACLSFEDIQPGHYQVTLINTGWILWSKTVEEQDVILSESQRGRNLKMAAATEDDEPQQAAETTLFNGNMILRILPGTESGTIEIECLR
jgi:hypothetical protein